MVIDLGKNIKVVRPEAKAMFPYSNSIYIDDDVQTLIDAGSGGRAYADIPVNNIELVLLSHNHFDHVNGVSFFKNARIMAGQEEAGTYKDIDHYSALSGFSEWPRLMGKVERDYFSSRIQLPDDVPAKRGFLYVDLAGLIGDGDCFNLGKTQVTAIHTPGHTPGHYAFYFAEEGILFSADIDISPSGPWYGGGLSDFDDLIKSVQKIIEINPRVLVTSHRRVFYSPDDNIPQLLKDFLEKSLKKEEDSLTYLSQPRTIDDIAAQDFITNLKEKTPFAIFWSKMMIDKHLRRLERNGKIKKIDAEHYVRI